MTPATPTPPTPGAAAVGLILAFIVQLTVFSALILIGWNTGLEDSEIVDNEIGWSTALGLSLIVILLRATFARGGSKS